MKKIFLSLAAMAFLAVGTVSCSSSDDSGNGTENGGGNNGGGNNGGGNNGGGNNGGGTETNQTVNTAMYDGEEFPLTHSELSVEFVTYNAGTDNELVAPSVYIIDGVGYNFYTQYAYSLDAAQDAIVDMTILGYLVENQSIEISNGTISGFGQLVAPNAISEEGYQFRSAGARLGGVVYNQSVTDGYVQYSTFEATSTSETELEYEGTSAFVTSYKNSGETVSTKFNGPILMYQEVDDAASRSARFVEVQNFKKEFVKELSAKGITKASLKLAK